MTPSIETLQKFINILNDHFVSYTTIEPRIYSGRGMLGEHCLGIVTNHHLNFLFEFGQLCYKMTNTNQPDNNEFIQEQHEIRELFVNCAQSIRQDMMGLSYIIYFPRVTLTLEQHSDLNDLYPINDE